VSLIFLVALYFVIWWTLLFAVLPIGVRSQIENGDVTPGSEGAAPVQPLMLRKVVITSIISAVVLAFVYAELTWKFIPFESFGFLSPFKE
jgi:predicted secreted protein